MSPTKLTREPPRRIALDANCFIDACSETSLSGESIRQLLSLASHDTLQIFVSRHTMAELDRGFAKDGGAASALADKASLLPYRPIGTIKDLVGTINDLPASFNDWRVWSDESAILRKELQAGAGIRDLGALYDAIAGNCDVFLTSDRHLCAAAIAEQIVARWRIVVMTPTDFEAAFVS